MPYPSGFFRMMFSLNIDGKSLAKINKIQINIINY